MNSPPIEPILVLGLVDIHSGYDLGVDPWPYDLPIPCPPFGPECLLSLASLAQVLSFFWFFVVEVYDSVEVGCSLASDAGLHGTKTASSLHIWIPQRDTWS